MKVSAVPTKADVQLSASGDRRLSRGRARNGDTQNSGTILSTRRGQVLTTQTDIRIGTRTDKSISSGGNDGKVKRVEEILAKQT